MNLENNDDLILFIEKEKLEYNQLNHSKTYKFYLKCLIKTVNEIHNKLLKKNIDFDIKNCIIDGTNMLFHVFWVLITYTNNIKLTLFLSERAILLFTEFIIMSKEPNIQDDLCYNPTLTDAIQFAYKKTIGPLKLNQLISKSSKKINYLKKIGLIVKCIIQHYYNSLTNFDYLENNLEYLCDNFKNVLLKLYSKNKIEEIETKVNILINYTNDINRNLLLLKIFLEFCLMNNTKKYKLNKEKNDIILNKIFNHLKNLEVDIVELKYFKKSKTYINLKKYFNDIINTF